MQDANTFPTADQNREAAVLILTFAITKDLDDESVETLLNAVYYLRAGKYPFNRTPRCGEHHV